MKVTVDGLGDVGMITDVDSSVLPPNSWDYLLNIRCANGRIEPMEQYADFTTWTNVGSELVYAHALATLATATSYQLIYPYDDDGDGACEAIYAHDGSEPDTDITRSAGAYLSTTNDVWTTTSFNGLAVLNNGTDAPQYWNGSGLCLDLKWDASNSWDATDGVDATYRAKSIRAYKNFLVAFDITDNGTRHDNMIHWSSIADPGVPPYWDYATTTNESGRAILAETGGRVLDGLPLGQSFVIYKEDSIYIANYVNNAFILDIEPQDTTHGLWCANAVTNIGGLHVVLGDGVVYTFDGNRATDILVGKESENFFNQIDPTNYNRCFLAHQKKRTEVWLCFPEIGNKWPTKALVWNYRNNTFTYRTLPACSAIQEGFISSSDTDAWDDGSETTLSWDAEMDLPWEQRTFSPIADVLIAAGDQLQQFGGGVTTDTIEAIKTNIVTEGDPEIWSMTRGMRLYGTGGAFEVSLGKQEYIDGPVTWTPAQSFNPGTMKKLDWRVNAPVKAIKVTSGSTEHWTFNKYIADEVITGQR